MKVSAGEIISRSGKEHSVLAWRDGVIFIVKLFSIVICIVKPFSSVSSIVKQE